MGEKCWDRKKDKEGDSEGQKWRVQRTRRCPHGGKGLYFTDMVPDCPYNADGS